MLSPQAALVYTMVAAAESDDDIADEELRLIGDLVDHMPIFGNVGREQVVEMAMTCSDMLAGSGRESVFAMIKEALSPTLRQTAFALARDVIAVDSRLSRSEVEALEAIRQHLEVDPAVAAVVEQAAQVRFQAA